eukprot:Amastigsp_a339561_9.p3 type:complete len:135 gc:universal Amastigsp_a339561_9:524-928(+)
MGSVSTRHFSMSSSVGGPRGSLMASARTCVAKLCERLLSAASCMTSKASSSSVALAWLARRSASISHSSSSRSSMALSQANMNWSPMAARASLGQRERTVVTTVAMSRLSWWSGSTSSPESTVPASRLATSGRA